MIVPSQWELEMVGYKEWIALTSLNLHTSHGWWEMRISESELAAHSGGHMWPLPAHFVWENFELHSSYNSPIEGNCEECSASITAKVHPIPFTQSAEVT